MKLREYLSMDGIIVPLDVRTVPDAVDALVGRLATAGVVTNAPELALRVREGLPDDALAIGESAVLLHCRSDAVSALRVSVGVAPVEMRRSAENDDAPGARVVLLVVGPPRMAARHLQVVRGCARLLGRTSSIEGLLAARTAADVLSLPRFADYQFAEQLAVRDLMTDTPRTTGPDVPLHVAAREMMLGGLGALPVVDDEGRLLGMLSERELVRHLLTTQVLTDPMSRHHAPLGGGQKTVRDVMTRQVLCVAPDQGIAEVASLMSNKDVERVPVVREGRLVGYLTRGDIVRKLIAS